MRDIRRLIASRDARASHRRNVRQRSVPPYAEFDRPHRARFGLPGSTNPHSRIQEANSRRFAPQSVAQKCRVAALSLTYEWEMNISVFLPCLVYAGFDLLS